MNVELHDKHPPKKSFQRTLRVLVVMMVVVGTLSGLLGPRVLDQLQSLVEDKGNIPPSPVASLNPTQALDLDLTEMELELEREASEAAIELQSERVTEYHQSVLQEQIRRHQVDLQSRIDHLIERPLFKQSYDANPLVNPDGTFNMKYHLAPSE